MADELNKLCRYTLLQPKPCKLLCEGTVEVNKIGWADAVVDEMLLRNTATFLTEEVKAQILSALALAQDVNTKKGYPYTLGKVTETDTDVLVPYSVWYFPEDGDEADDGEENEADDGEESEADKRP